MKSTKTSLFAMMCVVYALMITLVQACPTCIGNLDIDTPPLFSQEYEKQYALYDDGMLDVPNDQESTDEIH